MTAVEIGNDQFEPLVPATGAEMDPADPGRVRPPRRRDPVGASPIPSIQAEDEMETITSWNTECREMIAKIGGVPCDQEKCAEVSSYIHAVCNCQPPYLNGCAPTPTPGCCAYSPSSPVYVVTSGGGCYCCCSGAASGPLNAAGEKSERPVAAFRDGDTVYVATDGTLRKWETREVAFSAGTGPIAGAALRVHFRRGEAEDSLVVHRERPFLTPERTLVRAEALVPGRDALVGREGESFPVTAVEDAEPQALHHLATSRQPAVGVDGHLLLLNGVVAGDYALQLADLSEIEPVGA